MAGYLKVVLRDAAGEDVPGGRILVDGEDHGATPDTVEVTLGDHVLAVTCPGRTVEPASCDVCAVACRPEDAPEKTFTVT